MGLRIERDIGGGESILKRLLGHLRPYSRQFGAALLCMVIFGASDGAIPFLVKHILDGVFAEQDRSMLTVLPILLFAFALIRALTDFGQHFLMARVGHCVVRDIRNLINQHLLSFSPSFFHTNSSGNLLSRFTSDVLLVRELLTNSLASVIRDSIRIVALLASAIYLDPVLALIAFVVFPLAIFPVYKFGQRMRSLSKRGQEAIGALSNLVHESVAGNREVKIFNQEQHEQQCFEEENTRLHETFVKSEKVRALTGPVNEILATLAICGIILYGGLSVISGFRSQGEFIAFLLAVFLLYDPFKKLSRINNQIQQGIAGAERIYELVDTPPQITDPNDPRPLTPSNAISFEGICFSYPGSKSAALVDVDLVVPEGARFALVGFSGAGKSTLVDLLPRFIDPQSGRVLLGGIDIKSVSLQELRSRIAMVGQHTFLFNDTIYNNIAYGRMDASSDEVMKAAEAAYAYKFISNLPKGFDTIVGESGLTLSGGERQRIAIARALLKNAPILILDEATASLDNESEAEVHSALKRLAENRTSIVIAHRLSTVREADCIVVLRQGQIVERGRHEELLLLGQEYAKLHALQFREPERAANDVDGNTVFL